MHTFTTIQIKLKVPSAKFVNCPPTLNIVQSIIDVFDKLHHSNVCIGNPDDTFIPLISARKGLFMDVQGRSQTDMIHSCK